MELPTVIRVLAVKGSAVSLGIEAPPQINSGKPAKMNVQKKAIDRLSDIALKKCFGRVEDPGFKAVRIQQEADGVECARIIVDDCDHLSPC